MRDRDIQARPENGLGVPSGEAKRPRSTGRRLFKDHDPRLARERDLAGLLSALGREGNDPLILSNIDDGCGCRDRVADKRRCGKAHRLSQIHDLASAKLISQHRRNERAAQHSVRDTLAEPGRTREFIIKVDLVVVTGKFRKLPDQLVRDLSNGAPGVADLDVHFSLENKETPEASHTASGANLFAAKPGRLERTWKN